MTVPFIPGCPTFALTPAATAFGTVVTTVIPPGPAQKGTPLIYNSVSGSGGRPNWSDNGWYTHITDLIVTCSTTANIIYILRPTNFTSFGLGCAKNITALGNAGAANSIIDDPGIYSTNYRYPLPSFSWNPPGTVNASGPNVTDIAISSTNKIVTYQTADGVWHYDTITSGTFGSSLTLTTGTPNFTNGTIAANAPMFFYGPITATVPATGNVQLIRTPIVSTQQVNLLAGWGGNVSSVGGGGGASSGNGVCSLFPGDPLILYNPNATATTTIDFIGGYYARY